MVEDLRIEVRSLIGIKALSSGFKVIEGRDSSLRGVSPEVLVDGRRGKVLLPRRLRPSRSRRRLPPPPRVRGRSSEGGAAREGDAGSVA